MGQKKDCAAGFGVNTVSAVYGQIRNRNLKKLHKLSFHWWRDKGQWWIPINFKTCNFNHNGQLMHCIAWELIFTQQLHKAYTTLHYYVIHGSCFFPVCNVIYSWQYLPCLMSNAAFPQIKKWHFFFVISNIWSQESSLGCNSTIPTVTGGEKEVHFNCKSSRAPNAAGSGLWHTTLHFWILSSMFLTQRRQAEHPWVQSHLSLGGDFLTYSERSPLHGCSWEAGSYWNTAGEVCTAKQICCLLIGWFGE